MAKRLVWAPVWLVPVSSPVFYGGMFALPSVRPEGLRSTVEWDEPRHGAGPSDSLSVAGWFAPLKSLR
ncbi:MAG TPA: hypothetical protein VNT76_02555 [Candidatus Binatus sp.]|nr:hypothetical protein [Candidatus Binatus sp.]